AKRSDRVDVGGSFDALRCRPEGFAETGEIHEGDGGAGAVTHDRPRKGCGKVRACSETPSAQDSRAGRRRQKRSCRPTLTWSVSGSVAPISPANRPKRAYSTRRPSEGFMS